MLLLKKSARTGDVAVKCAWCGDSRAVMIRDGDADRSFDLSVDHKLESPAEIERIDRHYKTLLGEDSWTSREETVLQLQMTKSAETLRPEDHRDDSIGNSVGDPSTHSAASGSGRRGNANDSQDGWVRGGMRRGSGIGALDDGGSDMPLVEITMGSPAFVIKDVWNNLDGMNSPGASSRGKGRRERQREGGR